MYLLTGHTADEMTGMVKKSAMKRIFLDMIKVMRIIVGDRRHRQDDSLNLHHLNAASIRVLMNGYLSDEHVACIHQVDEVSNFFHEIIPLDSYQHLQDGIKAYFTSTLFWRAVTAIFFGPGAKPIGLLWSNISINSLCYTLGLVSYCSIRTPILNY
jgi:hypothetical protein